MERVPSYSLVEKPASVAHFTFAVCTLQECLSGAARQVKAAV